MKVQCIHEILIFQNAHNIISKVVDLKTGLMAAKSLTSIKYIIYTYT